MSHGSMHIEGSYYLCMNCGGVAHAEEFTAWRYDRGGDHGPEGALIPNPPGESDPLLKCPCCGELHGDCYQGAGLDEGTRADMEAERDKLAPEHAKEWLEAVAEVEATDDAPSPSSSKDTSANRGQG